MTSGKKGHGAGDSNWDGKKRQTPERQEIEFKMTGILGNKEEKQNLDRTV